MFSRVAHQAKSVVQHASVVPLTRPASLEAISRPAAISSASIPALRTRSACAITRPFSTGVRDLAISRDWPAEQDAWDGKTAVTPAGLAARQAMLHAPASQAEVQVVKDNHACRTGRGVRADTSELTTRIGMMFCVERPLEVLLEGFGTGVEAGLRELQIAPGDVVAEHTPNFPALAVRLALDGAKAYLSVPYPTRLREVRDELARYAEGKPLALFTLGRNLRPMRPADYYPAAARQVARNLTALAGTGFESLPEGVCCKALISRSAFDYLDFHDIDATVREAGRKLQPGGGLVFEFSHTAGRPTPASAGVRMNRVGLRDIEDAVREAGLGLRHLHVAFRRADDPGQEVIPTRRVRQDADGRINLRKADAAAWSGWDEICQRIDLRGVPVHVEVSGLFLKEGQAGRSKG